MKILIKEILMIYSIRKASNFIFKELHFLFHHFILIIRTISCLRWNSTSILMTTWLSSLYWLYCSAHRLLTHLIRHLLLTMHRRWSSLSHLKRYTWRVWLSNSTLTRLRWNLWWLTLRWNVTTSHLQTLHRSTLTLNRYALWCVIPSANWRLIRISW